MILEILTLCDFAQDNQGKLTIIGTFDTIKTENVPFVQPQLALAARVRILKEEVKHEILNGKFKIEIANETTENIVNTINGEFEFKINDQNDSGCMNISFNLTGFKFDNLGKYSFIFYVNEKEVGNIPLNIMLK